MKIKINTEFIKLDSFLKLAQIADSGGMAKAMVLDGIVKVEGEVCLMRGKKLYRGAKVQVELDKIYEFEVV